MAGQGTVAVHGAGASEFGAKRARIEANGSEPQVASWQDNKGEAADSGGEKRSQFNDRGAVATRP
jgi:hypothetical protein